MPPWTANGPKSRWIAPSNSQNTGNAPGTYIYRTTFDLTGFNYTTAQLTGSIAADDSVAIRLNGKTITGNFGGFSTATSFLLSGPFVAGVNTLDFIITNFGSSANPTGLRVDLSGTATQTTTSTTSTTSAPASISVSPSQVSLTAGQSQQFSATLSGLSGTVSWSASAGSISSSGLYTAPSSVTAAQNVTITAAVGSTTSTATVSLVPITISVSPAQASLTAGQSQQFNATISGTTGTVAWSASAGSISSSGLYTAPSSVTAAQNVTITATLGSASATATVSLVPITISVSPAQVNLTAGQSQQFSATVSGTSGTISWSASAGSISSSGLYTAPSSVTAAQNVTITAKIGSASATATVSLVPITISVSPSQVSLGAGQQQQFSATVSGTGGTISWSASAGSISSSGLYTAPSSVTSSQNVTITATLGSASATATVSLVPITISVSPSQVSLAAGQTQQFSATVSGSTATVSWSASVGSITSSGLYTAPSSVTSGQSATITATVGSINSTAKVSLTAPVTISVSPSHVSLTAGQTQQFSALVTGATSGSVSWSASVGSITSSGLYTAPSSITTSQNATITATLGSQSTTATVGLTATTTSQTSTQTTTVTLPIEVMGSAGTTKSVTLNVSSVSGSPQLWLQIHGLEYETQASVQVNQSGWLPINSQNVTLLGLASNYGGLGGGFSTLSMTMNLPAGTVVQGTNTVTFRFNGTDGFSSGYRVLALNFQSGGNNLVSSSTFVQDDPSTWTAPLTDSASIAAGQQLFQNAALTTPGSSGSATAIQARCGSCHAQDGRDLKYFNYSNFSIEARAVFHGLSTTQAQQIASYIRSLNVPNPGRPWNPPYQPGPGTDSQPVANWSAGAGLGQVLDTDAEMLPYVAPTQTSADFNVNANLSLRNVPVALQLMDWNHWLPRIHPLDAWGSKFSQSAFYNDYVTLSSKLVANNAQVYNANKYTFGAWSDDGLSFRSGVEPSQTDSSWSNANTANAIYGISLWHMVKLWEINQEFGLEGMAQTVFGSQADARAWYSGDPFGTSPSIMQIPPGSPGIHNGTVAAFTYISFSWYYLQLLLNNSNKLEQCNNPVDFAYYFSFVNNMSSESGPQAMVLLSSLLKALQVSQNGTNPTAGCLGWDPGRTDPIFLVTSSQMYSGLSAATTSALLNSYITNWLAVVSSFTPQQYYQGGFTTPTATVIHNLPYQGWADDVAYAIPRLRYLGLNSTLTQQLINWAASMWPSNGLNWSSLSSTTCTLNSSGFPASCQ